MRNSAADFSCIRLRESDVDLLRSLNVVFSDAFEDPETHLARKPPDQYLERLLAKPHFIALAALSGRNVVGGLVAYVLDKYEQERSEIYLYDLAVAEAFRRQGLARRLIGELKRIGREIGACVIFVQADREDEPAIELYRALGVEEEPLHFDISVNS